MKKTVFSVVHFVFLLVTCLISLVPTFSQDVKFSRIGSDQGLSQASVNCIMQDSKGYLWFGTQDGLNKYNGYDNDMIVYKHDPLDTNSLTNNWIDCLYEDDRGVIWVGTRGGGLNAINTIINKITRYENDPNNNRSLCSNQVKCVLKDKKGVYWVGTTYGLSSFAGTKNDFDKYGYDSEDTTSLLGFKVEYIYEDTKGRLWVCTLDGGLNLFNREKKNFTAFVDRAAGAGEQFYNRFKSISEDKQGLLHIAVDNGGVVTFDPEKKQFLKRTLASPGSLPENRISAICISENGTQWIGTKNSGICSVDPNGTITSHRHNEYDAQSLSNDGVNCICKDSEGNIWVGTEGGGVSVHFPNAARFRHYHRDITNEQLFLSNICYAVMQDREGVIWTGTSRGGITTLDRTTGVYGNYSYGKGPALSSAADNTVLSLYEDKEGQIWAGTHGRGLNVFDKKTKSVKNIIENGAVICIVPGHDEIIWAGIYGNTGLYAYDKKTNELVKYSTEDGLSSNSIYSVYEDKSRRVWIGTTGGGLNMMDYNTGKVKVYKYLKDKNSISSNTVYCFWDDGKGKLWIGTDNGLNMLDTKNETFTHYFEKDGLPNSSINGILGDKKGNLWISTNKGMSRFNPNVANTDGIAFKNFTTHDGLQSDEFAAGSAFLNRTTGEMFFGGINGFNAFYPDNIIDNQHIPPIEITSFKKFGKPVELDTSISNKKYIELSYKDNFISFEFAALDYVSSEKNKYQFMMEGLDNGWSPPSARRYVSYTNLPGGDYTFKVKGCNSDGVWNETGTMIRIKVIPPWWKTNAFYVFCVLFSIAFVFGFIRFRTARVEKEKKVLEQKVAERTAELAQKNKDITSSIQYAKRIQQAILPTREQIQKYFPDSFVFFRPKDIVSGDFYWFGEKNGRRIAACVDCTGHGVPGAFMSMIGTNLLNQIILENGITEPAAILAQLNQGVRSALKQGQQAEIETRDGMDIAICSIDSGKREVQFASALRHLIIFSDGKMEKIDGDKSPIGGVQMDVDQSFTNHVKFLKKGDMLYMFSDGYADQFGGEKGKKMMVKRLHELLAEVNSMSLPDQYTALEKAFEDWRGKHSQVDDVLVIGIRI